MRLFEHEEFEQALLQAARHFGVSEQFIEKDYYVTEILRVVASTHGPTAVFKGGTSLSKGWKLITRFSEDIDLFVKLEEDPKPGKTSINTSLKKMAEAVAEHPALSWDIERRNTSSGRSRTDYFAYQTRFSELPGISSGVLLEPGVRSGTFPTVVVPISSLVGDHLHAEGAGDMAEDLTSFEMTLLHFRRTFVETSRTSWAPSSPSRGAPRCFRRGRLLTSLRKTTRRSATSCSRGASIPGSRMFLAASRVFEIFCRRPRLGVGARNSDE